MSQSNNIPENKYGPLNPEVDLTIDFFSAFTPETRAEVVAEEAKFYKELTQTYSVDDRIVTRYENVKAEDGAEIPVKIYEPKDRTEKLPVHVFIHGGGWMTCSVETHDFVPAYIAANANCVAVSVEYRLAPENKFPIGLEDCYQAIKWVWDEADRLNVDIDRLSVGGDSAGGGLSAVLCLMAKERSEFKINSQILIYPGVDMSGKTQYRSAEKYDLTGRLTEPGENGMPNVSNVYMNEGEDPSTPYVSPVMAEDVSDLPPALFVMAECDPVCDQGLVYAKKLKDAGVSVQCTIYEGMPHAFILRTHKETFDALEEITEFIKSH